MTSKPLQKRKSTTTKNDILTTSINLFAIKGYDNVSIREIAGAVGIRGSSIYNHFTSKEDILDQILEHHMALSKKHFEAFNAPYLQSFFESKLSLEEHLLQLMSVSFSFLEIPNMSQVFRILSAEQFKSAKIKAFFLTEYIEAPLLTLEVLFLEAMKKGVIPVQDEKELAYEFHAPIMYDYYVDYMLREEKELNFEMMHQRIKKHIRFFCQQINVS